MNIDKRIEFWIITSTEDIASMNIREYLLEKYCFILCKNNWDNNPTYVLDMNSLQKGKFQNISE